MTMTTIAAPSPRRWNNMRPKTVSVYSLIILLVVIVQLCSGLPLFMVLSGRGKCAVVEAAGDTTLKVSYEAPDLLAKSDSKHGPTWISVRSKKNKSDLGLKTEEIFNKEGHLTFNVPTDGDVEICIRASAASSKNPMRFGLKVEQSAPNIDDDASFNDGVSKQWTQMEEELRLSTRTMRAIQAEADYSKDRDATFHKQSLDMYAASMYWPIVHVCVLLLTGFTQATHIVRFFKSRHIV